MKENWTYKKLGEVCGITMGQSPDSDSVNSLDGIEFHQGKTCFGERLLGVSKFFASKPSKIAEPNSVLLCVRAPVGYPNITDRKICIGRGLCALSVKKEINVPFLYYSLLSRQQYFEKNATGSTFKAISSKIVSNTLIPIPPMEEQEKIVAELDLLQSVIDKKKAQLDEYDKLAQSIFYEMFGECKNNVEVSKYIKSLGGGKSLAGQEECINKVLKTGAVTYDFFNEKEVKNLPVDYIPNPEHLLHDGDILISRMNTLEYVGACAYVWKAPDNTYLPDRLWRAVLGDNANPIFIWFSLIQDNVKEQIRGLASGTSGSMKNISMPRFLSVKIKEVPLSLQQSFAEKIEAIEHQKELVKQSLNEVKTLFDSRMDYYFN